MLPAASALLRRILREETDRLAAELAQFSEEYVSRKAFVFRGKHRDGRRRDQLWVVYRRASQRTGIPAEEIGRRYPGHPDLGSPARVLWGSSHVDPELMAAHKQRMGEIRERRAAEVKACTCAAHLPHCPTPDNCVRPDSSRSPGTPAAAR